MSGSGGVTQSSSSGSPMVGPDHPTPPLSTHDESLELESTPEDEFEKRRSSDLGFTPSARPSGSGQVPEVLGDVLESVRSASGSRSGSGGSSRRSGTAAGAAESPSVAGTGSGGRGSKPGSAGSSRARGGRTGSGGSGSPRGSPLGSPHTQEGGLLLAGVKEEGGGDGSGESSRSHSRSRAGTVDREVSMNDRADEVGCWFLGWIGEQRASEGAGQSEVCYTILQINAF